MPEKIDFNDRMLSLGLARVSEAAALASARLIGRGEFLRRQHGRSVPAPREQYAPGVVVTLRDGQKRLIDRRGGLGLLLHCSLYSRIRAGSVERSMTAVISTSRPVVAERPRLVTVKT